MSGEDLRKTLSKKDERALSILYAKIEEATFPVRTVTYRPRLAIDFWMCAHDPLHPKNSKTIKGKGSKQAKKQAFFNQFMKLLERMLIYLEGIYDNDVPYVRYSFYSCEVYAFNRRDIVMTDLISPHGVVTLEGNGGFVVDITKEGDVVRM